jgi:hypothetical protein
MNLDKTIKELQNRLDIVHPYSDSFDNNHRNRNDGINYWKGKKIIYTKNWNDLYEKNSIYTNAYTTLLTSRKPLQYFPNDYNGSISSIRVIEELNEEAQKWNIEYHELLEYRKNPTLGKQKCSKCLLSGSLDDPIFNGIEKVFARIVMKHCNNNNSGSQDFISYHCNVMNLYSCPFKSKEEFDSKRDEKDETTKYPYTREDLFSLHQISFAIEQAISTFFEITKQNEIIFEVDFANDRVQEIHTKYNGEPESWGWQKNINDQLFKVKPISNIVIRDENDIYNILTNKEKLEYLIEEYENKNSHRLANEEEQLCCDEKSPCVLNDDNNSNEKKIMMNVDIGNYNNDYLDSHKGKNRHSKKIEDKQELDKENIKPDPESKIKEEFEKSVREQIILLKENKEAIIDFLLGNKDSIRIEDLKIYEPIYKCYKEKGNCHICNGVSNIICKNCSSDNKERWLCINHWKQYRIDNH